MSGIAVAPSPADNNGKLVFRLIAAALMAELSMGIVSLLFVPAAFRIPTLVGSLTQFLTLTGFMTAATVAIFAYRAQQKTGRSSMRHSGMATLGLFLTMLVWGQILNTLVALVWPEYLLEASRITQADASALYDGARWLAVNWSLQLIHVLVPLALIFEVSSGPRDTPTVFLSSGRSVATTVTLVEATLACGLAGILALTVVTPLGVPDWVLLPGILLPGAVYLVTSRSLPAAMPFPSVGLLLLRTVTAGVLASGIGVLSGRLLFSLMEHGHPLAAGAVIAASILIAVLVRTLLAYAVATRLARGAQ